MTDQDKKRFAAAMVGLYKSFNKPSDIDITRILYFALEHLTIENAEKCIELAILNSPAFPTPHALKKFESMIPAKPVLRLQHTQTKNEEIAKDANKLITAALDGKLSEEQLVEGMTVMHTKYPNAGWSSEAASLVSHYRKRDFDIAEEAELQESLRLEALNA